jgi:hypothetical protein
MSVFLLGFWVSCLAGVCLGGTSALQRCPLLLCCCCLLPLSFAMVRIHNCSCLLQIRVAAPVDPEAELPKRPGALVVKILRLSVVREPQ